MPVRTPNNDGATTSGPNSPQQPSTVPRGHLRLQKPPQSPRPEIAHHTAAPALSAPQNSRLRIEGFKQFDNQMTTAHGTVTGAPLPASRPRLSHPFTPDVRTYGVATRLETAQRFSTSVHRNKSFLKPACSEPWFGVNWPGTPTKV